MKLRWLSIENFLCYGKVALDLPVGTVAVVGPNGAGKSSFFEAVSWALFGYCRNNTESIRADFAAPESPCRVELAFDVDGRSYTLTRELRGKAQTPRARLTVADTNEPLAEGARPVTTAIQDLLGMSQRTFFASVFSRQKQVDALTEIPKGERQQAFRRMLGLEALDEVVKRIKADIRDGEFLLSGLNAARKDPEELEARRTTCRDSAAEARAHLARATTAARAARAAAADARRAFEIGHGLEQQYNRLTTDLEKASTESAAARKAVAQATKELRDAEMCAKSLALEQPKRDKLVAVRLRLKELDPLVIRHTRREEELHTQSQAAQSLRAEQAALAAAVAQRDKLAPARDREVALARDVKAARTTAQAAQDVWTTATAQLTAARAEAKRLDDRLAGLRKLGKGGNCPTCLQQLGDAFADAVGQVEEERGKARAAIADLVESVAHARKLSDAQQEALRAIEERHQKAREAVERLNEKEAECREQEKAVHKDAAALERSAKRLVTFADLEFDPREYERLKEQEASLAPREAEWMRLAATAQRAPEIAPRITDGTRAAEEWDRCAARIEHDRTKIGFDPQELKRVAARREKAREQSERSQSTRADARVAWTERKKDLAAVEQEIREERERERRIREQEDAIRERRVLHELFCEFRQALTDRIRPALAAKAGQLLERATSGRYARVELDEDYEVQVYDGGQAHPLHRYSGGESDLINLCLRIAISKVVADRGGGLVNLLVLDEVFGSQDTQRKDGVLRALEHLAGDFQQVFVITHDEFVKDRLEHVLEIHRDPGSGSRVGTGG